MSGDMKFESGVAALVEEARRMCPKLTPRLWRSDGRVVAIAGGLLGHRELLKELRDAVERTIETLLRPDGLEERCDWVIMKLSIATGMGIEHLQHCAREDANAHSNTDDVFNNGGGEILRMESFYNKVSATTLSRQCLWETAEMLGAVIATLVGRIVLYGHLPCESNGSHALAA